MTCLFALLCLLCFHSIALLFPRRLCVWRHYAFEKSGEMLSQVELGGGASSNIEMEFCYSQPFDECDTRNLVVIRGNR